MDTCLINVAKCMEAQAIEVRSTLTGHIVEDMTNLGKYQNFWEWIVVPKRGKHGPKVDFMGHNQ